MNNQGGGPIHNPFGNVFAPSDGTNSTNQGMNEMAANMAKDYAMNYAKQQMQLNQGYFNFLSLEGYKKYFDVTNSYVFRKFKIILMPFLLKEEDWKRGQTNSYDEFPGQTEEEEEDRFTPKNDV